MKKSEKKEKLVFEGVRMPKPLQDVIFKESLKRSKIEGKKVAKSKIILEALNEKFLPAL